MPEAAITLPLDIVERLIDMAEERENWDDPKDVSLLALARAEVAQVKEMLNGHEAKA